MAAHDPEQVGGYRLIRVLGEGGQGVVHLGQAPSGRKVAVKVLHPRMASDPKTRQRFLREAELTRRVAAFCTAQVLDIGITEGDQPFMVSEYVPGPSLQELVVADGPRHGGGLDRLAVATLTALSAIHRGGIVHRDFKPSNVIMGPEGPVVIDFGIAHALEHATTRSGIVGTPAYLSPEQLNGHRADAASDVFAWAATIVYAATGHLAFPGDTPAAVIGSIVARDPDLNGVPGHLGPLMAACLAKNPARRPAIDDLLTRLTQRPPARAHPQDDHDHPVRAATPHSRHGSPPVPPSQHNPPPAPVPAAPAPTGSDPEHPAGPNTTAAPPKVSDPITTANQATPRGIRHTRAPRIPLLMATLLAAVLLPLGLGATSPTSGPRTSSSSAAEAMRSWSSAASTPR
ncbi:serine/threonine-protein kinase [Thermocatellispora tengchongensis]|uniref:serine/threonine-protein kinase n=1 Tax=Thermocatellispora tengchongensis TaxID=1073253 RepID=UPI00363F820B